MHWLRWGETGLPAPAAAAAAGAGAALGPVSKRARALPRRLKEELAKRHGFRLYDPADPGDGHFHLVFTAGAEESDAHVVHEAVRAFVAKTRRVAHVVLCRSDVGVAFRVCEKLRDAGQAEFTRVPVRPAGDSLGAGTVDPGDIGAAIKPTTCLVCVPAIFSLTGAANDLRAIGGRARRSGVPLHVSAGQALPRLAMSLAGVDSAAFDFHRIGAPPGLGVLLIRHRFVRGYGISALVPGPGGQALRAGRLSPGLVLGALAALKLAGAPRPDPRASAAEKRRALAAAFRCADLLGPARPGAAQIVWLGGRRSDTLLFAVVGHEKAALAAGLAGLGVHVVEPPDLALDALDIPPDIFPGALCASGGDFAAAGALAAALAELVLRRPPIGRRNLPATHSSDDPDNDPDDPPDGPPVPPNDPRSHSGSGGSSNSGRGAGGGDRRGGAPTPAHQKNRHRRHRRRCGSGGLANDGAGDGGPAGSSRGGRRSGNGAV